MFKSKKEKKVRKLIEEHFTVVQKSIKRSADAVRTYFAGELDEAKALAIKVDRIENNADELRREIYELLGEGAFLPILRGDIHELVGYIDSLAGLAEELSDATLGERPHVPEGLHEDMLRIVDITTKQCSKLKKAVIGFFQSELSKKEVRSLIREVAEAERRIDEIEWDLTRSIFTADMDLAQKLHLKMFLTHLTLISNKAEDVSDELSELIIKMQI